MHQGYREALFPMVYHNFLGVSGFYTDLKAFYNISGRLRKAWAGFRGFQENSWMFKRASGAFQSGFSGAPKRFSGFQGVSGEFQL